MSTKKLHLVSLGCTKNLIDSEVMLGKLKEYEITDDSTQADLIIVNTCGFIESAKQESLNTIFELDGTRKEESVLVMAGCLSERYQDELKEDVARYARNSFPVKTKFTLTLMCNIRKLISFFYYYFIY